MKYVAFFLSSIFFILAGIVLGQSESEDINYAPYFHITHEGISADQFPLMSTHVQAHIIGPMVDVTVEQTYKNSGSIPIEAIYVFPASTRSAVYAMEMRIGDRKIVAEIQEKDRARRNYEDAKAQGRRASLLEQHRTNVFQMNVANILPEDIIHIRLQYHEMLLPEERMYTWVYPTVVGPRFVSDKNQGGNEAFAANPYLLEGQISSHQLSMLVNINIPTCLGGVKSTSHQIETQYISKTSAKITLDVDEKYSGNRDFILQYQMAADKMAGGTMLFDDGAEKYFLTVVEPPKRVVEERILPREYIFVVDISGSMHGFPLDVSKQLMADLIGKLNEDDLFNVMLFAGSARTLSPHSLPATKENLQSAQYMLNQQMGAGGTELLPALRKALLLPKECSELSRSIVVVTDGYITVEEEVYRLIEENLQQANLFAFGIGSSVNRELIEGMANAGRGEPFVITDAKYAHKKADRFRKYIQRPILTNINIRIEHFDAYDILPKTIPDLMAERPIYVFGKYRGDVGGAIVLQGTASSGLFEHRDDLSTLEANEQNSALQYLWAREKIRQLQNYNHLLKTKDRVKEITELGLAHNLMTNYTSFVAIDTRQMVQPQDGVTTVRQALPLPLGVSNYAVGFEMSVHKVVKNGIDREFSHHLMPVVLSPLKKHTKILVESKISDQINGSATEVKARLTSTDLQILFDKKGVACIRSETTDSIAWNDFIRKLEKVLSGLCADLSLTVRCIEI